LKMAAKRRLLRALNLTNVNTMFTVGKVTGLLGVRFGAFWALNQVRNKNACMQVRIGADSSGGTRLSWSLVYSAEILTDAGLADGLHKAGVWKRKDGTFVDTAVRRSINLTCDNGKVAARGGGAGEVFDNALSFVF